MKKNGTWKQLIQKACLDYVKDEKKREAKEKSVTRNTENRKKKEEKH